MKRHSVVWTLTLVLFLATSLTVVLSGLVLLDSVRAQYLEREEQNLRRHTHSIAHRMGSHMDQVALTPQARERLSEEMIRLSQELGGRMCIVNWKGEVLEDSSPHLAQQVKGRWEVYEALNGRYGSMARGGHLYVAIPMMAKGKTVGAVYSSRPLKELEEQMAILRARLLKAGGWALLVAFGLSLLLGSFLTRPLARLALGVRQIASGDYAHRLDLPRRDELGELAQEIDSMAAALERHRRVLNQFVSDASHELKTPLASLKALSEALADGAAEDPERRERFLGLARAEVARMEGLVSSLLQLQRADAGHDPPRLEACPLHSAVEQAVAPLKERSLARLEVDVSPDLTVTVDQEQLLRVLSNLLENALRACQDSDQPLIRVKASSGESGVVVEVVDNGPGVPEADQEKVFERFYRCERDRSRESGGSGLGLAICRQLVEGWGGRIWCESGPGGRFKLEI